MSISVSGDQSQVPPGFRFHPTEEELLLYYLRKKVDLHKIDFDVIQDVDLNKLEPWDIQEKCKIGSTPQNEWYFFSHKDKKYPTGTRTNRATAEGFWKATGRDKVICSCSRPIGRRKTLVFYNGRAPNGQKSDWIMHEYRLDTHDYNTKPPVNNNIAASLMEGSTQEEGWVVCRIFKKKNHRTINIASTSSYDRKLMLNYSESPVVDGTNFEQIVDRFIQLPGLESPDHSSSCSPSRRRLQDWATLDRMVASQLNGEEDHQTKTDDFTSPLTTTTTNSMVAADINDDVPRLQLQQQIKTPSSSSNTHYNADSDKLDYNPNDSCDLWSCLMRSSSSLLCNFPNEPRI